MLDLPLRRLAVSVMAFALIKASAQVPDLPPPGFRPPPHEIHALVGARIFTKPGQSFEAATIVLERDRIVAAGPDVAVPPGARVWDCRGWTIYPGFIDPYFAVSATNLPVAGAYSAGGAMGKDGSRDFTAAGQRFFGVPGDARDPGNPGPGHELPSVVPELRVVANLTLDPKRLEELREMGFTAANVTPSKGIFRGTSALVGLGSGSPNRAVLRSDTAQHLALEVPGGDGYPNSLMGVIAVIRQTFMDARHYALDWKHYDGHSSSRRQPEFNAALAALVAHGERKLPTVVEVGSALMVERASEIAREFGLSLQIVSSGQEWRRPDLVKRAAVPFIVPLAIPALPKFPSEDGWESVSLDQLRAWDWAPENPALLRRLGAEISLTTHGLADRKDFRRNLRAALDRGLSETDALAALTTVPARMCGVADRIGSIERGKLANLVVVDGPGYFNLAGKVRAVWVEGTVFELGEGMSRELSQTNRAPDAGSARSKTTAGSPDSATPDTRRIARAPAAAWFGHTNPPVVAVVGATVWTCGPQGVLTNATLVMVGGKVRSVERGTAAVPTNAWVIPAAGLHVTPGLIDCHNHSMILGGVNEATLPSTAMVRIGDVVNSETDHIHQQLAGGLTVANLLHGSANPIGGQNCVIKLRQGASPADLKLAGAPAGIKFALGENVKQSNWGEKFTTRFPQSRMGVGTFFANRFTAARQYLDAIAAARMRKDAPPVRRDLELEALGEIIEGTRLIHCHSYRQDEILAFLRTMESFGVRVATLQHVLEGYKVADEIARHGAGASAFSDWWGFKFEVLDAIPYAGSLMRERGVTVSFNSDSDDHARRLNLEAAKAVKYGETPPVDALQFVTINSARQLRIDSMVGSLEPGKDADFVVWSGHPLDSSARCLQTWIDGKRYFDRESEPARTHSLREEREALVAKARARAAAGAQPAGDKARQQFFQVALEQARFLGVSGCLDCRLPHRQ